MKRILHLALILFSFSIAAQPTLDYVVQVWAEIEVSPPKISIHWEAVNGADVYTISRKEKSETSWGTALVTFEADNTSYEDTGVELGVSYEYKILKEGNVEAYGYINVGIEVPAVHQRGRLLLLVDNTFSESLVTEIDQLIEDLIGDGWEVNRQDVDREGTAIEIKEIVVNEYNADPDNLDAIFCLGHVPVPYSGNYAPDGHTNNHQGAWPTDGINGRSFLKNVYCSSCFGADSHV